MFEQKFDDMSAEVWFDKRACEDADQEGIGKFEPGNNLFFTIDALLCIKKYDAALKSDHYAAKRNRLRAQRNSIVTAFGPEMAERVGF